MIQQDMLYKPSLNYIKKEQFSGSYEGLRYMLERYMLEVGKKELVDEETGEITFASITEPRLRAWVWPEPLAFEKTAEELKQFTLYDLTQEGLQEAWDWIGTQQDELIKNKG